MTEESRMTNKVMDKNVKDFTQPLSYSTYP